MSRKHLHSVVRRSVAVRIIVVAVLLGTLFGGLAIVTERNRSESTVLALALAAAGRFNEFVQAQLDAPAGLDGEQLQDALDGFVTASGGRRNAQGRFVLSRIFDRQGDVMARVDDESFAAIGQVRAAVENMNFSPPADNSYRIVSTSLNDQPYIAVTLPLLDSDGQTRAWLGGVFALSDAEQARLQANVWRTFFYVLAITLVTALVLYPVIASLLQRVTRLATGLLDANLETLQVLGSAIAKRDSDTDAHNYRVTVYSVRLGESIGLKPAQLRELIKGALLHDVGKLGIRDNVLLKPGKLDHDEFEVMKTHVNHGLDITGRAHWLAGAKDVVGAHHEKFGGRGYPQALAGEDIPLSARIFAIADVFDALTSHRPYKEPLSFEDTMAILEEGRGEHFDPELLDQFAAIAGALYEQFGGGDGHAARAELNRLLERYFRQDAAAILQAT